MRPLWLRSAIAVAVLVGGGRLACADPSPKPQGDAGHEAFGLIFCYAEMLEPKEFLQATPCVAGVNWRCTKEDDTHWYGDLHYPTENSADYRRGDRDGAPQYYMVMNLAIKKQKGLPIDPAKFQGALVLRDPSPDKPLAMRGDGTSYELVGYEDQQREDRAFGFLFANHKDLKFIPAKK